MLGAGCVGATPSGEGSGGGGLASPGTTVLASPGSGTEPPPSPTATPTVAPLGLVDLRYRLVDEVGRPLFCDPDFYPVGRGDESQLAEAHYPAIRADTPTYQAITSHLGIDPTATPTAAEVVAIYRAWKMLRALDLEPVADGYRFDYVAADRPEAESGWHVTGVIGADGTIRLTDRVPSGPPPCPICLARGVLIATPDGSLPVEDLRPGMAVLTADRSGAQLVAAVVAVASTPVPPTHRVVALVLADGQRLEASPGHPLPDGRRLGSLRPGDPLDGTWVVSAELVPYRGGATFDLLPSGPTGTYWANGIPLASTLRAPD